MAEGRERDASGRFASTAKDSPDDATEEVADDQADAESSSKNEAVDISDTVAPSIGPHTTFTKQSPEERLAGHEQSETDAMGMDKRRTVIGGSYSPSFARQATLYGIVVAVVVALGVGFKLLADKLDEPPKTNADAAPWAAPDAPQKPPKPLQ
jgi:hypothetical protein